MFAASINKQKNKEPVSSFLSGASGENRTLVPSLENLYTNRCTTLAYLYSLRNPEELWGGKSELNRRPSGPQSDALTN